MSTCGCKFHVIVGDLQKGLHFPNVSSHSEMHTQLSTLNSFFEFANVHLHEDVCMFVFLPNVKEIKQDVMTSAATYDVIIAKGWWSINELLLCSGVDNTLTVCDKSCIIHSSLFIRLWLFSSNLSFMMIPSNDILVFADSSIL